MNSSKQADGNRQERGTSAARSNRPTEKAAIGEGRGMAKMEPGILRRSNRRKIGSGRSHRKFLWIFGGTATICALLYWEQAALLYVLSTLAMCVLMLVVAFSNLEAKDNELS